MPVAGELCVRALFRCGCPVVPVVVVWTGCACGWLAGCVRVVRCVCARACGKDQVSVVGRGSWRWLVAACSVWVLCPVDELLRLGGGTGGLGLNPAVACKQCMQ